MERSETSPGRGMMNEVSPERVTFQGSGLLQTFKRPLLYAALSELSIVLILYPGLVTLRSTAPWALVWRTFGALYKKVVGKNQAEVDEGNHFILKNL